MEATITSGPLPQPQMVREYEDILSGSTDRIIKMAEQQAAHRQRWEMKSLEGAQKATSRSQWFGFVAALAAIGAATYLAANGAPMFISIMLGGAGSLGLVGAFVSNIVSLRQKIAED